MKDNRKVLNLRAYSYLRHDLERIEKVLGYYRHLSKVRALVVRNSRPITLNNAAQAIGISQSQLSRLFRDKVGISFREWLALRQVHDAMELIRERQISACDAAYLSGFASYRSFVRNFKRLLA